MEDQTTNMDSTSTDLNTPAESSATEPEVQESHPLLEESSLDLLGEEQSEGAAMEQELVEGEPVESPDVPEGEGEEQAVDIDGQEYSLSEIQEALEISRNQSEWNRKNTQRAQELAEIQRELDAREAELESTQLDEQPIDQVQYSEEDLQAKRELERLGYMHKSEFEKQLQERLNPLESALSETQKAQVSKGMYEELDSLVQSGKIKPEQKAELVQFGVDNDISHLPYEDVWYLMNKENIEKVYKEEAQEDARVDLERKERAKKLISTRGAQPTSNSTKYNPKTDKDKSTFDLLAEKYL